MPRRDAHTRDLFVVPQPAAPLPGSLDFRAVLGHLLTQMFQDSGLDRFEISGRMSRLAGKDVSKYMLDGYTAESREEFNLPAWLIPAAETACESHAVSNWLAGVRGGRLLVGRDALNAELGRVERQRDELASQARALRDQMRRAG